MLAHESLKQYRAFLIAFRDYAIVEHQISKLFTSYGFDVYVRSRWLKVEGVHHVCLASRRCGIRQAAAGVFTRILAITQELYMWNAVLCGHRDKPHFPDYLLACSKPISDGRGSMDVALPPMSG